MLRENVRYARFEMRLPIVRRADGLKRDDVRVADERRQLERIDAERLFDDLTDLARDGAHQHARDSRLHELLLGAVGARECAKLGVLPRRAIAEQQRCDVDLRQWRIGAEHRPQPLHGARCAQRDAIGLLRHAHLRLGGDVERRLDAHGVREVEPAARQGVPAPFEDELAARDVHAAKDNRALVRASERQIRARDDVRVVVLDAQRARRDDAHVEAHRRHVAVCGRSAHDRHAAIGTATEIEQISARIEPRRPDGVLHRHQAREHRRRHTPRQRQIGVDFRSHAFRIAQTHVAAGRGQREIGRRICLEADPAVEVHLAVGHARRQPVEPDVARVEQDGAVHRFERVRQ